MDSVLETVSYGLWKRASLSIFKSRDKRHKSAKKGTNRGLHKAFGLLSKEVFKSGLPRDGATFGRHALDGWQVHRG